MLENVRFHKQEEKNDPEFAKQVQLPAMDKSHSHTPVCIVYGQYSTDHTPPHPKPPPPPHHAEDEGKPAWLHHDLLINHGIGISLPLCGYVIIV